MADPVPQEQRPPRQDDNDSQRLARFREEERMEQLLREQEDRDAELERNPLPADDGTVEAPEGDPFPAPPIDGFPAGGEIDDDDHSMQEPEMIQNPQGRLFSFSYKETSFLAAATLLFYAFRTQHQYYLVVTYLTSSKYAYVILGNAFVAGTILVFEKVSHFFLNGLRLHEAEGLQDFFRWNVTETCLALTMFRDEITVPICLDFLALILLKCLHHVAVLREGHLRMTQEAFGGDRWWPVLKADHARLFSFLIVLQLVDFMALGRSVQSLTTTGPSVQMLFAFESAILLVSAWSHILLCYLHWVDSLLAFGHERSYTLMSKLLHPWKEIKATLQFAVELQGQAIQFIFYMAFFGIVLTYYGMPINLFREVFMSFAALRERIVAFWKYRRLMASMNRFSSVTEEQLEEAGNICIICRDEMTPVDCKSLPVCQHMFHKSCLREWLVQQQSCPTCRSDISAMEAQERARTAAANAAQVRGVEGGTEDEVEATQRETGTQDVNNRTVVSPESTPSNAVHQEELTHEPSLHGEANRGFVGCKTDHNGSTPLASSRIEMMENTPNFPAVYRVLRSEGISVLDETSVVVRTIPYGKLVLCMKRQRDGAVPMLRLQDGWIRESSVLRIKAIRLSNKDK